MYTLPFCLIFMLSIFFIFCSRVSILWHSINIVPLTISDTTAKACSSEMLEMYIIYLQNVHTQKSNVIKSITNLDSPCIKGMCSCRQDGKGEQASGEDDALAHVHVKKHGGG